MLLVPAAPSKLLADANTKDVLLKHSTRTAEWWLPFCTCCTYLQVLGVAHHLLTVPRAWPAPSLRSTCPREVPECSSLPLLPVSRSSLWKDSQQQWDSQLLGSNKAAAGRLRLHQTRHTVLDDTFGCADYAVPATTVFAAGQEKKSEGIDHSRSPQTHMYGQYCCQLLPLRLLRTPAVQQRSDHPHATS